MKNYARKFTNIIAYFEDHERLRLIQAWWYMPMSPAFWRLRQEDHEFKASLGYIGKPFLKRVKKKCHRDIISSLESTQGLLSQVTSHVLSISSLSYFSA
jgi:hypothetical protein